MTRIFTCLLLADFFGTIEPVRSGVNRALVAEGAFTTGGPLCVFRIA
jgi:hypothetical protein